MYDIRKDWTAISTLLVSSAVYTMISTTGDLTIDVFLILLGRRGPGGDRVLCKEYGCNLQDTFKLIGCAITMNN